MQRKNIYFLYLQNLSHKTMRYSVIRTHMHAELHT